VNNFDNRVAAIGVGQPTYPSALASVEMREAIGRLAAMLEWNLDDGRGAFGGVIPDSAKVVVKPNWVMHENQGPWGIEPLLTHASVVATVVEGVLQARPSSVILGDAPLQSCDFDRLLDETGIGWWAARLADRDPRFAGVRDFRRTRCVYENGVRRAEEDLLPLDQFVLFDLAHESLLEPVTTERAAFRVTQYDPAKLANTHSRGRHQYLVARAILEADVVVNLPKLKTHKKAGLTCALKNLIGINGNKEFLPHHRIGGSNDGGDCYPGSSRVKRALELAYDRLNTSAPGASGRGWSAATRVLHRVAAMQGDTLGVEGSWSGNDTIWRTCLDLNRILLYGRVDGSMADDPQRRVVNIVDAIVAGHGDGPLAPRPAPMGILFAGCNSAAVDRVGAALLGYDPELIPIVHHASDAFRWPLRQSGSEQPRLIGELRSNPAPLIYPQGWTTAAGRHATRRAARS
jgi:uncharacterized protein (DUF362 family)